IDLVDIENLENNSLPNIVRKLFELNWSFVIKIPTEAVDLFEQMLTEHIYQYNIINDEYYGMFHASYDPFYPYQILKSLDYMIEFYNLALDLNRARLLAKICH
ncbi:hypothetical protein MXB_838, partial [Myxobolus squamalis]